MLIFTAILAIGLVSKGLTRYMLHVVMHMISTSHLAFRQLQYFDLFERIIEHKANIKVMCGEILLS